MHIEDARKQDAADLAHLINIAGEGLPMFLWSAMVEGDETPFDVGIRRASREEGGFSYQNARVIRREGHVAGMIISYPLDDPYEMGNINDYPDVIRPLIELEAKAPGTWYINGIATLESFRQQGIAKALMLEAEEKARANKLTQMSIIVASENLTAKAVYQKMGYQHVTSLPVYAYSGAIYGGEWELMLKSL